MATKQVVLGAWNNLYIYLQTAAGVIRSDPMDVNIISEFT